MGGRDSYKDPPVTMDERSEGGLVRERMLGLLEEIAEMEDSRMFEYQRSWHSSITSRREVSEDRP
jgi:hypothetical protein